MLERLTRGLGKSFIELGVTSWLFVSRILKHGQNGWIDLLRVSSTYQMDEQVYYAMLDAGCC